jgi:hypothetical protein
MFLVCFSLPAFLTTHNVQAGAALWGIDYTMQMAASNFSGALMHVGGQNVFYNVRH